MYSGDEYYGDDITSGIFEEQESGDGKDQVGNTNLIKKEEPRPSENGKEPLPFYLPAQ